MYVCVDVSRDVFLVICSVCHKRLVFNFYLVSSGGAAWWGWEGRLPELFRLFLFFVQQTRAIFFGFATIMSNVRNHNVVSVHL